MAVTLIRAYGTFASGSTVILPDSTEAALIAQGYATAATGYPVQSWDPRLGNVGAATVGGNVGFRAAADGVVVPTAPQGPRILANGHISNFASLGTDTTPVAGTLYRCEIFVPYVATWKGLAMLNGSVVGTDKALVALYDTNGVLITSSAVAGTLSSGANAFQNRDFVNTVTLTPGRYFLAVQIEGTTMRFRSYAAVNGGNQMCSSSTGTFGTVPTSFTPPTTFSADTGPIARLYQ